MGTLIIQLQVHAVVDRMPDLDTDVLVFEGRESEAQLGAWVRLVGHPSLWVGANGDQLKGVTHWAPLPVLGRA